MRKILLIIIDGLGDRPISQLGNKTPLEAARTPNLDWLAKNGICGLVEPYLIGEKPESDICHLALFGYDPKIYYLGRGPYEAAGAGLKLREGDIALRANFATVSENLKVIDRRAGRIEKTEPLIQSLKGLEIEGVKFLIKKSYGHRAVLILRYSTPGVKHLLGRVSDGDPHRIGIKVKKILPSDNSKAAKFTAKILNEFLKKAHLIFKNHPLNKRKEAQGSLPANYLLVRGAGEIREMGPALAGGGRAGWSPKFKEKYGLKACCIAGGALYKGIGKILGIDLIKVRGATGLPNTNLKAKLLTAKKSLNKYDFIFLHIKAADSLAEDGNFFGKKEFIEKIDKNLKPILNLKDTLIIVTADHSTCSLLKRHCRISIPILISGADKNTVEKFSEKNCRKGKLGKIKQINLMTKILKYAR